MQKEEKSTLEGFLVKKRKVLLPQVNQKQYARCWIGANKLHLYEGILLQRTIATVKGYQLYGTDIPVVFCYPHWKEMVIPNLETCIGVETRQWPISSHMIACEPNGNFCYNGKVLLDEKVLEWLENERNVESMRRVREWALEYGKNINQLKDSEEQSTIPKASFDSVERQNTLINRNKVLVAKYTS